jgi:hypothetical protein
MLFPLLDPAQLVDDDLERPQHGMQERALALEQPRHEEADGLRQREDDPEEEEDLEDAYASH